MDWIKMNGITKDWSEKYAILKKKGFTDEEISKLKISHLEELKKKIISQNPSGLMAPYEETKKKSFRLSRKWRLSIFWGSISVVLIDLLRRPIAYTVEHWRGDLFLHHWKEFLFQFGLWNTKPEKPEYTVPVTAIEHTCSFLGFFSILIAIICFFLLCTACLSLLGHLLSKYYQWANEE